ncbi:MAG: hypothetical protein MRK02_11360 [Candidatus Scalindua sp.]|nr:hypothetical protein [Candidatus Scalindua sp.]
MRNVILCAGVIFMILYASAEIGAKEIAVFEKTYVRGTGKPITKSDTFSEIYGLVKIRVTNGGLEEKNSKKVSSAEISLNGEVIFAESKFKKNGETIEARKTLSGGINTLDVTLKGKPGGVLAVQVLMQDGVVLPPDPGEEGTLTLLGTDSDGDGVRDDIQRYIYFTYPDDEKLRLALTHYAIEFQGVLADAHDREASYNHATNMSRHNECLFYLKDEESFDISDALLAEILNTRERSIAYITYSDNLGGKTFKGAPMKEWKDSCSFDVDAIGGVE